MKFKYIFIIFYGFFVLAITLVKPVEASIAADSNEKLLSEHIAQNQEGFRRQNLQEKSNNDNNAYQDIDYSVDLNRNELEDEESWFQSQQSQKFRESRNSLSNLSLSKRAGVSLFEEANDGDDYDQEHEENQPTNVNKDTSFTSTREKVAESENTRKFLKFPKISKEGEKISTNLNPSESGNVNEQPIFPRNLFKSKFSIGAEQYADSLITDISGCQQCSKQAAECSNNGLNMANKSVTKNSSRTFNENGDNKSLEFEDKLNPEKGSKTRPGNGSKQFDQRDIIRNDDENDDDDRDWALLKFSIANADDNRNWNPLPLNDQLENTKNTLSHEADYKLSKMEQDNSADKLNNNFWKCGIFKRSHTFNPMHLIQLKTSERLMHRGFGARLPSSSLAAEQLNYAANDFANQPHENANKFAMRKAVNVRNDRQKREKEIQNSLAAKAVKKENVNATTSETQKSNITKDNSQKEALQPENELQTLELNNNQELSKVLDTFENAVNLEKALQAKAFAENTDNFRPRNRRRKRSINSETDLESKTFNVSKARHREETKALWVEKNVKTSHANQVQGNLRSNKSINEKVSKAFQHEKGNGKKFNNYLQQNSFKKHKSNILERNKRLQKKLPRKPNKSYKSSNSSFPFRKQTNSKAFMKNKAFTKSSLKTFKRSTESLKQSLVTKLFGNKLTNNTSEDNGKKAFQSLLKVFNEKNKGKKMYRNVDEHKRFSAKAIKESAFEEGFPKKIFNLSSENYLSGNKSSMWQNNLRKAKQKLEQSPKDIGHKRSKRSIDSFPNENHIQSIQGTNFNNKAFDKYFKGANKTKSALQYKKYAGKGHSSKIAPIHASSLSKPKPKSHRFYENSFKNHRNLLKNKQKLQKVSKSYTAASKNFKSLEPIFFKEPRGYNHKPQAVEALKNRYLNDLENFNQNYKFNDYPTDWSVSYLTEPNDNKTSAQDDSQSANMRNEILNCQSFSSLEDFLKSMSQNTTPSDIINNTTTPATTTLSPNEASFNLTTTTTEENFSEYPDEYQVPTTCITLPPAPEEATETFSQSPEDNCTEIFPDTDEKFPSFEEATEPTKDLKLNISIRAKIQGNPLSKDFYGNGSLEMMPGLMEDRKRRGIFRALPKQLQQRKCAAMPTVKPDFIEDSEDIANLATGKLSSKMVETIFKTVQNEPSLKGLWPSLKPIEKTTDTSTNFNALSNMNNEAEVHHAEELFKQSISAINNIIETQLRSQACVTLRPDLQVFYNLILRTRQEQELARAKRNSENKLKNNDFNQRKSSRVKKLLKEYEILAEHEQQQLLAAKVKLLNSFREFQQLQGDEKKRRNRDLVERHKRRLSDVSVDNVMKTLPDIYSQEFIKLLKVANFYRASRGNAEGIT